MENTVKTVYKSSESGEQEAVIDYCDLMHIPAVHIPNEGKRSISYGAKLKRMGMRRGFPDIFIARARGKYHGLVIEMKYDDGKTTKDQKDWLRILSSEGYAVAVVYSADAAIGLIKQYEKLKTEDV